LPAFEKSAISILPTRPVLSYFSNHIFPTFLKTNARHLANLLANAQYTEVPGDHGAAVGTKEFADNVLIF